MNLFNPRIASLFVLAICFSSHARTQTLLEVYLTKNLDNNCERMTNPFMELGAFYQLQFAGFDSAGYNDVKKVKFKSKDIELAQQSSSPLSFGATAVKTGNAIIKTKLVLNDGTKIIQNHTFTVLELPELIAEITVTSPDSKFMWLNLIDKNTGQSANSSFNLCSINFVLLDSSGVVKEEGHSSKDDDYFPSVTLRQLPVKFQLNDRVKLQIVVNHYETNLPVSINQELIISQLWN